MNTTNVRGNTRVALLEHTDEQSARELITLLFDRLGYDVDIISLENEQREVDGNKSVFAREVIDVFVTDLSLGSRDNFDGLDYIRLVKRQYPDILSVAISRHDISVGQINSKLPTFDVFIDKTRAYSSDLDYLLDVEERIRKRFSKNVFAEVDFAESHLGSRFKTHQARIELSRLTRALTFTTHAVTSDTAVQRVVYSPLAGGYSRSDVFRMRAYTRADFECINTVVKLSDPIDAATESTNYHRYVKWYLPYTWRVELLAAATTARIGALCYSFAYNDEVPFNALVYYIERKDDEKIAAAIDKIFHPDHRRWYHAENLEQDEGLTRYYSAKWRLTATTKSDSEFERLLEQYVFRDQYVIIQGEEYDRPRAFLLGEQRRGFMTCLCHGDLHGGNVLVSDNNEVSFIDFQATGRGHVFEDFVMCECNIRFWYDTKTTLEDLLVGEMELSTGQAAGLPYARHAEVVRRFAFETFPEEEQANYYYALALCCYRLLRVNHGTDSQKRQLIACLLANMKLLANRVFGSEVDPSANAS